MRGDGMKTMMTYHEYRELFAEAGGSFCYLAGAFVRTVQYMPHWHPDNRLNPVTGREAKEIWPLEVTA